MTMKTRILLLFLSILLFRCTSELPQTLDVASGNRDELLKVLTHYEEVDIDPEKYKAAFFLIENMQYHESQGLIAKDSDTLRHRLLETDSIYHSFSKGHTIEVLQSKPMRDSLWHIQDRRKDSIGKFPSPKVVVDYDVYLDCRVLSSEFLINHIDNAFKVWEESKFAKHLSFDEFKEYILPYRSMPGAGFHVSGNEYNNLFNKYLFADTSATLNDHIEFYHKAVSGMRYLNGDANRKGEVGIYDLYCTGVHDCVGFANYACNILRACGIPSVIEYNVCYDRFGGRHFICAIYDSTKTWLTFSPESDLPEVPNWDKNNGINAMNAYRQLYGAQKDTPFFLKAENEYVPEVLNHPCIKDVTSYLKRTAAITIPFEPTTSNKLAYLATFHKANGGTFPVTWGVIDTLSNTVTFDNALPNKIYFPVYYPTSRYKAYGEPFYVTIDSIGGKIEVSINAITDGDNNNDSLTTLVVNRKFARKPNMIKLANELVGGKFLGANRSDYSDAKVLYEITTPPEPYFLSYALKNKDSYKFYRFEASEKHPHAHISMLEWITYKKFDYPNSMKASRAHITSNSADAHINFKNEGNYVKLLDAPTWDEIKWKAEYDGNMQTAPSPWRNIYFRSPIPCIATHVRFAPKNADNGIKAGDNFKLYYWDMGWKSGGSCIAEYEYVSFDNIPTNKLYWLVNTSRGSEELPFVMVDNKQHFLYHDIL